MIRKPIEAVTFDDVVELVRVRLREGREIDYKQELPDQTQKSARNDFLYDVTSFANAGGGDIIYGVEEERDEQGRATGIPSAVTGLSGENIDISVQRLQNMIRSGIDPAIPGIRVVPLEQGGVNVLLVRVPQSWAQPHMVSVEGLSKFYIRVGPQKQQLDREGIRRAFLFSEGVRTRVDRFRDDRLGRIIAGETTVSLVDGIRVVIHFIPLTALDSPVAIDPRRVSAPSRDGATIRGAEGYNIDGKFFYAIQGDGPYVYTQVFRSGAIEYVESTRYQDNHGNSILSPARVERNVLDGLNESIEIWRANDVLPPALVLLAITRAKGAFLLATEHFSLPDPRRFDRDNLIFPEIMIDRFDADMPALLKPMFDALWQASGFRGSYHYIQNGIYQRP